MSLDDSKYKRPIRVVLSLCDYTGAWSEPFIDHDCLVVRVDPKHDPDANHGGTGYTPGSAGSGRLAVMDDGGLGLALTAGALADRIAEEGGYFLDSLLWAYYSPRGYDCCEVYGVLAAPPCTDFAVSGARWFAAKDADGRTEQSVGIVRDCLRVVDLTTPEWWALENPVGRLQRLVPELGKWRLRFHPYEYAGWSVNPDAEAYTKNTCLWGDFNPKLRKAPVEPVFIERGGKRGSWMWANLGGKSERTKELRSVTPSGFAYAFCEAQTWR